MTDGAKGEKRESRRTVWRKKDAKMGRERERENVFDRQSKFQWEEVTEERMQTKGRGGIISHSLAA